MQYYVIRQISTGCCFPGGSRKGKRGYTYSEPVDPAINPPRLFKLRSHAVCALGYWLLGKWYENHDVGLTFNRKYDRVKEDFEIVSVNLSFAKRRNHETR